MTDRTKCWIILASTEYEGSWAVSVHTSESAARRVANKYNNYHETKPEPPNDYDDAPAWAAYSPRQEIWENNHPAGIRSIYCEEFIIEESTLFLDS